MLLLLLTFFFDLLMGHLLEVLLAVILEFFRTLVYEGTNSVGDESGYAFRGEHSL